jgi:hypothetical protein
MLDSDASTAKTLTLVAIILQTIFFAIGAFATLILSLFFAASRTITYNGTVTRTVVSTGGVTIVGLIFSIFFVIAIVWILLDYFLIYKKLADGKVQEAETPSLVLGLIQLILGGVITGILLILAYVKIRDSLQKNPPQTINMPQQ